MDIWYFPGTSKPVPIVVAIHGGGWYKGSRASMDAAALHFLALGYAYASIDYRLSSEAIYPAQIEDCKCAIRFLRAHAAKYHIDPSKIGAWGDSAGGHLAALLGTTAGIARLEGTGGWQSASSVVQAVVDLYGPTDLRGGTSADDIVGRLLGGSAADKRDLAADASPVVFASKSSAPMLILHGSKDPLVSPSHSRVLYDALKEAGADVTLNILPGAGHGGMEFYTGASLAAIDAFCRRVLPVGR